MKVPLSWLRDFVAVTLTPEELAYKLTFGGLEVEDIEYAAWRRVMAASTACQSKPASRPGRPPRVWPGTRPRSSWRRFWKSCRIRTPTG